jgi:hypothetical protein
VLLVILLSTEIGVGQVFNPTQTRLFSNVKDTLVLDSLSLVPGSFHYILFPDGDSTMIPKVDYRLHALVFKKRPDSIFVRYKRFPYNFEKLFFHKDMSELYTDPGRPGNLFTIRYNKTSDHIFQNDGLNKNGNISRGISFGNNQDVVVNSNLNLQVNGKLTPEIDLVMAATDNNIPFQADGTTAQLQEFDKVFIQLSNYNTKMIVGDYQLSRPQNSYFMNFYKRAQGLYLENSYRDSAAKQPLVFKTQVSGAVSRGKFARQVFFGTENNQGPYRLKGAENEPFIIVLSGTEKIYIDGKLMQRGQENDYIIDYNTGELSFTARQLITKDKRIVAEFQYAERNYARSLFFFGEEVETKRTRVYFNFFSEQDNKNRPLLQTLSQLQKNVMIGIGDTLDKAVYTGVEEATFNNSDVFYTRLDTLVEGYVYPDVYVYSTNPEFAKYRLKFSNVGAGRGNYQQVSSSANGRVYVWVAPVNGQPVGSYEPVIPLVTPRQQQMLTAGVTHSLTKNNTITAEGVYTKNDINRFSSFNKRNDEGSGVKIISTNQSILDVDRQKAETKLIYNVNYEFLQKQFTQVERFRSIEFDRDWNRPLTSILLNDQHLASASVGLLKTNKAGLVYTLNLFDEGNYYEGLRHNVSADYKNDQISTTYQGAYLQTTDRLNHQTSDFYRHKALFSKRIDKIKVTYNDVFENNLFYDSAKEGMLLPRSYRFWEWEGSISNADSSKNNARLFYRQRRDMLSYSDMLKDSTLATNIGLQASIYSIRNNPISVLFTYRKLELTKNLVGGLLKPDNTLLNRVEYNPRYFKGIITAGVFYETGYGLENKREFYYIEVAPGQGQYAWNDYNNNQVKELNEFETAQFSDQARYIRIYTPTNDYVKVLQNQLSVSFNVRPSALQSGHPGPIRRLVNRWTLQTAVRHDNKIFDNDKLDNFNPLLAVPDSMLLATNNNIRQSVFFNQSSAVFGADYTYIDNQSRQLLTNGLEKRTLASHEVKWRLNFFRSWSVNSSNTVSEKSNSSKFFTTRNYLIHACETEQKLIYQPSTVFRVSGIYKYAQKRNGIEGGFQKAILNTYAMELKYNQTEKGVLSGRMDFIKISYNDAENSSIAYEMLNGLSNGNNFTWELSYQRNLNNNIQVSINYNGRKTPNAGAVHLGGAQVRAFF